VADYKIAVEKALTENTEENKNKRVLFARSHTWENNVAQIYQYIQQHIK
jgi:hypothetical protein